ncbi:MAG TPA: hypothetical protein VK663_07855 [Burkholderiales bacterium]|nr:hypothetical protein [Burkholderiales bacterium]
MKMLLSLGAGAIVALVLTGPVSAQTLSAMPNSNAGTQTKGVHYVAGGVGLDARAEMQGLAASHNLLVKFAEGSGDYVVPDSVSVRKGSVDVLSVADSGPLLYVNLPNGVYTVVATYKGVVRSKEISVAGRSPDLVLTWPAQQN